MDKVVSGASSGSREPDPQAVPALSGFDPARLNKRAKAGGHGVNLAAISREEICNRLLGDADICEKGPSNACDG